MGSLNNKLIFELKSRFFDIIDAEISLWQYDSILLKMLIAFKDIMQIEEATYYSCNEWVQQFLLEGTTNNEPNPSKSINLSLQEYRNLYEDKTVFHKPLSFKGLEHYDLLLPLKLNGKLLGILLIKEKNTDRLNSFSDQTYQDISDSCASFMKKIQTFAKTLSEEKRYKQLYRVTEKFHSSMNMDDVLGEIIITLQEVYPTFTYFLLLSQDNNSHSDLPIKDLEYDSENIAAMQAYVTGTTQFEDSIYERRSVLYAPLKGKQGVYGVLQVIAPNTLVFPKNEVEFISLLANTAGNALENAQLYQQSRRLIADLQLINETSHRLNSNLRLSETMAFMCEQITSSFDAEEVGFFLLTKGLSKYRVLPGSTAFFHSDDSNIYTELVREKIEDEKDSLFIGDCQLQSEKLSASYRSIMAVPMVQSGVLKGFSIVVHREPYHFSFETFKLLQSLIHHSTLAFANSMLREELEKMVVTDHLTKLYSRNYLDDRINSSMEEDAHGTFILIDLDNFKVINDTFGHQVGDDVLIQVANIIENNIRASDVGARWGGEELAIYLPNVPLETGISIAERLVEKVSKQSQPQVTISCGVSYWKSESYDTAQSLFSRADKALYRAKGTGKNKVVIEDEVSSESILGTL
ncbi:diguanylate cyclase domain-containing protein [Bacillus sp. CGMCC 1.16607]|uniref:sensor domain-containing diguanylate cyclase n=1 Tax=Bacillus sp. CGMCC 1.16607 TaxID=3351842 RepID=UPI0036339F30